MLSMSEINRYNPYVLVSMHKYHSANAVISLYRIKAKNF